MDNHSIPPMPICMCGNQLTFTAVQEWNHKPNTHYCECHAPNCQFNNKSTYTAEGWQEYVLRAGYTQEQYETMQALGGE